MKPLHLGNNVTVAAHSLVNKSFGDNVLLAGCPADVKKANNVPWYELDNYKYRVKKVLELKEQMGL